MTSKTSFTARSQPPVEPAIRTDLLAHVAEAEPKISIRPSGAFAEPVSVGRGEHGYLDTTSNVEKFTRKVMRLWESSGRSDAWRERTRAPQGRELLGDAVVKADGLVPTLFEVSQRAGIWKVTKDGGFYGDYFVESLALEAAEAAVRAVVANGGSAEVVLLHAPHG